VPAERGASPVVVVAATVLSVVALTLVIYATRDYGNGAPGTGSDAERLCPAGEPDRTYTVSSVADPDPPVVQGTIFELTIRQGDRVVTGARVCLYADMPDMSHSGFDRSAFEVSTGQYEVDMQFGMGGRWRLDLTVAEPGRPAVSVPLFVDVSP